MTVHDQPAMASLGLPHSDIALAALAFTFEVSQPVVANHCVRSYLFARELASATGLRNGVDYDDELVYVSCLLHDLGVTDHANGDQRFEVDGADAAATFLRGRGIDEERAKTVWTAIALHTSVGLAHRFGPVAAVAQMGIGADVVGAGRDELPAGFAARVHDAWPRHDLGYALGELIAGQVHRNPGKGGPMTLPGHVHDLYYSQTPVTWFDAVAAAGWGDSIIAGHHAGDGA